jgi:predicted enzyme related to lactoylglutathione lyase
MPRIVHFEVNADNPERAVEFYTKVFGWKVEKWDGPIDYWLVMTGEGEPGIDGAITPRQDPPEATVNTVDVPSVDEYVAKVKASGGTVLLPKQTIPSVGYLAYCKDTEGNTFGLMTNDPNAA